MSTSKRITPGENTATVLYIVAAAMTAAAVIMAITATQGKVLISGPYHFGLIIVSQLVAGLASTMAAAAEDGLFAWPTGGPVDPAPHTRLPRLNWQRARTAMMRNFNIISFVCAVWSAALIIAAFPNAAVVFTPEFHFFAIIVTLLASAYFLLRAAAVEDRKDGNPLGTVRALWIITVALVVLFAVVSISAGNGHILFSKEFTFGSCVVTLASAGVTVYAAGRRCDSNKTNRAQTSFNLFLIALGLAVEAAIAALVATNTILFSAEFHVTLVIVLAFMSACTAVWAALLRDRDA